MILRIAVVGFALVLGLLLKGSLRGFEDLRMRWWGLVVLGLALQLVPLPSGRSGTDLVVRVAVLALSYASLILFVALNVRWRGCRSC